MSERLRLRYEYPRTWSETENGTEYVRADLLAAAEARCAELRAELEEDAITIRQQRERIAELEAAQREGLEYKAGCLARAEEDAERRGEGR